MYDRELDRARTSPSFVNIFIPLSPVKMSQRPSFLQPRLHYFPPYLTQKLTKSYLINNMHVHVISGLCCVRHIYILLSSLNCNNFDRAPSTASLELISNNNATCSSGTEYELYGGF